MVLRKPYAFLIKYFKIIHAVMVVLMFYVTIKTYNVFSFLSTYISNGQVLETFEDLSGKYVGLLFILAICILIVSSAFILYLMKHKKKPWLFYILVPIVYVLLLVFLLFTSSFIYDMQFEAPDLRFTKIIRDIYLLFIAVQIPFILISLIRAVGFDIKKFDFKSDLMELDIEKEDDAEFEVSLGLDTEDLKSKIRKYLRLLKYYYQDNKVVFFAIFTAVFLVVAIFSIRSILSIERVYKENQTFNTRTLAIKVLDSYKTIYDNRGNPISDNNFYVIVKLRYTNKSNSDIVLNLDNARLSYTSYNNVAPTTLSYNKFLEFGVPYYGQNILPGETRDFILVYELDKEYYYNNNLTLKYLYDIQNVNNQQEYKYRKVKLSVKDFDEVEDVATKKMNEELSFSKSILGDTKITITNMELANNFVYNITRCKNGNCNKYTDIINPPTSSVYDLAVMRLDYKLTYDDELDDAFSLPSFISRIGSIRFVINGKEYNNRVDLIDVTPYSTDGCTFLTVRSRVITAEKIYLDFTIRDKRYTYILKDEPIKETA